MTNDPFKALIGKKFSGYVTNGWEKEWKKRWETKTGKEVLHVKADDNNRITGRHATVVIIDDVYETGPNHGGTSYESKVWFTQAREDLRKKVGDFIDMVVINGIAQQETERHRLIKDLWQKHRLTALGYIRMHGCWVTHVPQELPITYDSNIPELVQLDILQYYVTQIEGLRYIACEGLMLEQFTWDKGTKKS